MIATLSQEISPLVEFPTAIRARLPLKYRFRDGIGRVGFIASVSRPVLA